MNRMCPGVEAYCAPNQSPALCVVKELSMGWTCPTSKRSSGQGETMVLETFLITSQELMNLLFSTHLFIHNLLC